MTLRNVQTCDRCGDSRDLEPNTSRRHGGWRQLDVMPSGDDPLELCATCVREVRGFLVIRRGHAAEMAEHVRAAAQTGTACDPDMLHKVADMLAPPADAGTPS